MQTWEYAVFVHEAKGYGGPEKMIKTLTREAQLNGALKGGGIVAAGFGLYYLGRYAYGKMKPKVYAYLSKKVSKYEEQQKENEIIQEPDRQDLDNMNQE